MGDGWIRPAQVELVASAILKACDKADGSEDSLIQDPVGCKARFQPESLRCAAGQSGDQCLGDAQIAAIKTLHATYKFPFPVANGLDDYPGWGVSGENTPAFGPTGGWISWWLGTTAPAQPPAPSNGIAWIYGAGGIQYVFARDPKLDVTTYKVEDHKARVLEVSQLMDSTNPDLSRFQARGGKLVILEHMADYAQSPYAGIRYFENVERTLGKDKTASFARLYTAPGVDHVGSGAPANIDMLSCWSTGWRTARRRAISKCWSRRWQHRRLKRRARCRCADGRPGRITNRVRQISRRVSPARRDLPFSPCGRRWRASSDARRMRGLDRRRQAPHPSQSRVARLIHPLLQRERARGARVTSPASSHHRRWAGMPGPPGWSRSACNSHKDISTLPASLPRTDTSGGRRGRPGGW